MMSDELNTARFSSSVIHHSAFIISHSSFRIHLLFFVRRMRYTPFQRHAGFGRSPLRTFRRKDFDAMRFEYYHEGLAEVPKLSVDGTVENALHLSHWAGNATPEELRADTSTEIALNFVASPRREELARGIEVATNNHFDTDGVLSVWTVLAGERALALREELIAAAAAGDFSEFTGERAVRASVAIQGGDNPFTGGAGSPLARARA